MKSVIATLIVLASTASMAKTFVICPISDIDLQPTGACRTVTDNLELGVPSNAAQETCSNGEGTPCEPKKHSNGYVPVLSEINDWFYEQGATAPEYPGPQQP